jgi:outer membrane receptor protein involved in Fe transport
LRKTAQLKSLFLIAFSFCITVLVNAQTGSITGKVISASSGIALPSASLFLIEKTKTAVADINGNFSFNKLNPGTYSIKCSYGGFSEKIIDEIVVKGNDNTSVSISLVEKPFSSDAVIINSTIRVRAAGETVSSLLIAQKNSASVSDGITIEQIKRTPDKSTSDVLKRVSGASIQDDRFAIVRGLNDRYNAAFINGAPLPSTESDRKAFAFDIFPSALLDNLVIYKTATPDKTGEFAGGIIDITTKSIPSKNFVSLSYGTSVNSLSTGKVRYHSENKGKKDWIGLDDGTRAMPDGIPSNQEIRNMLTYAQKAELAKKFANYKWGILKDLTTKPNFNFQLSSGFNIQNKGQDFLGALFSVNYYRNYSFNSTDRNGFDSPVYLSNPADTSGEPPIQRARYKDSLYNDEVVVAMLANFAFKINSRHTISLKNNLSINTDNRLYKRMGNPDYGGDSSTIIKETVRWFTSNQIFSSQLGGDHLVGPYKTKINWLASFSKVIRDIPNLSRSGGPIVSPPAQTSGSGTMFFSNSNENIKSIKLDITQPYTFMKNSQNFVKLGAGYQIRKRNFTSRLLGFEKYDEPNGVAYDNSLTYLPEDQIFLASHLGKLGNGKGGFILDDGTLPNSDYDASSSLVHAYLMNDQRLFKKFRLIYGARLESFNQKLNSLSDALHKIELDSTVTDILPSANLVYALTPKINIRLSYSRTVNRPEFRELAPFLFFDYQTTYTFEGTESLKRATIDNFDFRAELFPGKAQLFSLSGFYKKFKNPIEILALPATTNQTKYVNTSSAKVYGAEIEIRMLLSTLAGIKKQDAFLSRFTLSINAAYIKSNVHLNEGDSLFGYAASQVFRDRPLVGQSPYILNGSLGYEDDKNGFSATVSANRVGDRIYVAGIASDVSPTADIYERSRTVIDLQIAKSFFKKAIELKFTAKDILSQNQRFYFDFDSSQSFTDKDRYFSNSVMPKTFTLTASLKL